MKYSKRMPLEESQLRSVCSSKDQLLHEYDRVSAAYSCILSEKHGTMGTLGRSAYADLSGSVELARLDVERARTAISTHVAEHGC